MGGPINKVLIPMGEVYDLSLVLIEFLEEEEYRRDVAAAACALTLARLVCPTVLEEDQEVKLTQDLITFAMIPNQTVH